MFRYAATYYADPEAQYLLGKHYLLEKPKDSIQAARWLRLAANKGEHRAQALLGGMLFRGEEVSRQAALGLFWLIVAKDGAAPEETWITEMYADAVAQANENDRTFAHKYLEDWLKRRILLPPGHTPINRFTCPNGNGPESLQSVLLFQMQNLSTRPSGSLLAAGAAALALILAAAWPAPAVAADLSVAPMYRAVPAAPMITNWSGAYIGIEGGGAWGSAVVHSDVTGSTRRHGSTLRAA
jgi:hypothetical protein